MHCSELVRTLLGTGQSTILEAVADYTTAVLAPSKIALPQLPGMSLIGSPDTHAQVYLSLTTHWIACTLRYRGHARCETHSEASITGKGAQGPGGGRYRNRVYALTLVRYPAERTWKEEA